MANWTLEIAGRPTLVFAAEDYHAAHDLVHEDGPIHDDLTCLDTEDGGDPEHLYIRKAFDDEADRWSRSLRHAILEGNADNDNADDWVVFLIPVVDSTDDAFEDDDDAL